MRILPRLGSLWNTLVHRDRLERELDDEIRAAVETLTDRFLAQGMPAPAARRAALARLGGVERIKDDVRDGRVGARLDSLALDFRYAWRGLRTAPGLTTVIVLTLALGIGANTSIFSVVHAMLVAPLPYRDADRLVFIWADRTVNGYPRAPLTGPELRGLREASRSCEIAAIWTNAAALTDGDPEQLRVGLVTANFFQVLGVEPALGRTFRKEDGVDGAAPAILISWEVFQRRFGADPTIVGRQIQVDDQSTTLIGVMPRDFRLLLPTDSSVPDHLQAWVPLWPDFERTQNRFLRVIGRVRPETTIADAGHDIAQIASRISRELGSERVFTTVVLQADDVREIRGPLLALFAGVGILLTIACVNVAGLLIARAASRARETALRLALGASRGRLLRQSLVEGLLLTGLGAVSGVIAGAVGLRVLLTLTPESLSRLSVARLDLTVMAFTLGVSVLWGVIFSLAPLAELFKADPARSLQRHWRTMAVPVRYRTRAGLAIVQVALSLVLLVGAGLLVRAFVAVLRVDAGFRTERQLTFRMAVPLSRYGHREAFNTFAAAIKQRLSVLPGVTGVGAISHIPYDDLPNWGGPFGLSSPVPPDSPNADLRAISPGLFEALGVRLVEGRFFTDADDNPESPVAIVDEKVARQLWPGRSALGQRFYARTGAPLTPLTVVGVVPHLRVRSLVHELVPQVFVPWRIVQRNPIAFVVRADRGLSVLAGDVRGAVASVDPRVPIYDVRPMDDYVEAARSTRLFTMLLAALFAAAALALTCVGVYGVLAYSVAHRRHEFGVRRALGADESQVRREVLREGMGFALVGCLGGLVAAAPAARLLESQLYGIHPRDSVTYGVAVALILGGAAVACWIPALRATTISPMDALRTD